MMPSLLEPLLVYALVALCAAYCLWAFLPGRLKQRAAQALLARFGVLKNSRRLQKLAQPQAGCGSGCGSCGDGAAAPGAPAREQKIQLFKRR